MSRDRPRQNQSSERMTTTKYIQGTEKLFGASRPILGDLYQSLLT